MEKILNFVLHHKLFPHQSVRKSSTLSSTNLYKLVIKLKEFVKALA